MCFKTYISEKIQAVMCPPGEANVMFPTSSLARCCVNHGEMQRAVKLQVWGFSSSSCSLGLWPQGPSA